MTRLRCVEECTLELYLYRTPQYHLGLPQNYQHTVPVGPSQIFSNHLSLKATYLELGKDLNIDIGVQHFNLKIVTSKVRGVVMNCFLCPLVTTLILGTHCKHSVTIFCT